MRSLVLADYLHPDFNAALSWLADHGTLLCCHDLDDVRQVRASADSAIDLVVFAQARPGRIDCETVEQVHRHWPLARMMGLLGSWCEGEVRTGRPWPGVVRVYWHQWAEVLAEEVARLDAGDPSMLNTARIAIDPIKSLASRPRSTTTVACEVLVSATQSATITTLKSDLEAFGLSTLLSDEPTIPEAIVFDCDCVQSPELIELATLRARNRRVPIVVLAGFPRRDDVVALRRAGATHVISKPYRIKDLIRTLCQLAQGDAKNQSDSAA